jgi:hypothetical protein
MNREKARQGMKKAQALRLFKGSFRHGQAVIASQFPYGGS